MPSVAQKTAGPSFEPAVVGKTSLDPTNESLTKPSVLVQHCAFWDRDGDNVIWPQDTFVGFRDLGYNLLLSVLAMFIIHSGFSYPTKLQRSIIPDPFFRLYLDGIHKAKHGSDTGTYTVEGYFQPQIFESSFQRYARTSTDFLTVREVFSLVSGQRVAMDPFGWFAAVFEFYTLVLSTYDPESGVCPKESILGLYDGTFFWHVKECRESGQANKVRGMKFLDGVACLQRGGQPKASKQT